MTSSAEPPEGLRWIIGSQHIEAWTNAAHWLHANSHIDVGFVRQRVTNDPCEDCWRAAVYATKGVVLAGYHQRQSACEAVHYRGRWASTVIEARRQAARADAAEASKAELIALSHMALYHSGIQPCPAPDTCPAAVSAPTT